MHFASPRPQDFFEFGIQPNEHVRSQVARTHACWCPWNLELGVWGMLIFPET